jgi:hypothetical protein
MCTPLVKQHQRCPVPASGHYAPTSPGWAFAELLSHGQTRIWCESCSPLRLCIVAASEGPSPIPRLPSPRPETKRRTIPHVSDDDGVEAQSQQCYSARCNSHVMLQHLIGYRSSPNWSCCTALNVLLLAENHKSSLELVEVKMLIGASSFVVPRHSWRGKFPAR